LFWEIQYFGALDGAERRATASKKAFGDSLALFSQKPHALVTELPQVHGAIFISGSRVIRTRRRQI
jgi:hypothetical protein